mgnify:FL=1
MTIIPIEEEYGYRYWIWETPDTFENAVERFEDVVSDENFFCMNPTGLDIGGEWKQVEYEEWKKAVGETNTAGHLHESGDSWIHKLMEEV